MVHDPYRYSLLPPPAGGGYSDSEYPYLRYEDGRFCPLIKDDFKSKRQGISGIWGADLYAESHDCIHWEFADDPAVYTRRIVWSNGAVTNQANCAFCLTGKGLLLICFLPQEMESRTVPVFKNVEYGDSLAESTNLNLAAKYFFCKAVR